jgi:hypothetical protein
VDLDPGLSGERHGGIHPNEGSGVDEGGWVFEGWFVPGDAGKAMLLKHSLLR